MNKPKTRQIMSLQLDDGRYFICIRDYSARYNQYKLYYKWYNQGWKRKKINEYADLWGVLYWLLEQRPN